MERAKADCVVFSGGMQYHIHLKPGNIPPYVLLPGDPGRIDIIKSVWDEAMDITQYRQYRSAKGKYKGVEIAAVSTGIGAPAVEIAVVELANIGAHTLIRVGSTGAIQPDIEVGDLIISVAAVRLEGASRNYAPIEYPAVASLDVTLALIEAAESLGYRYHVGITASTDSFYAGQERLSFRDYLPDWQKGLIERLRKMNVLNFEMEASALFVMASVLGIRAGAVSAVFANRITNVFEKKGEKEAAHVASEAVKILKEWDDERKSSESYWKPIIRRLLKLE